MSEKCVWCSIKMVPGQEVCHSTHYAEQLPTRIFKCEWDVLPDGKKADAEEPKKPSFAKLLDSIRDPHPHHPEVQADEPAAEEEKEEAPKNVTGGKMEVIWGVPWKADAAKAIHQLMEKAENEEHEFHGPRHHGRHGGHFGGSHHGPHHGKFGGKKHGHHGHCFMKCAMTKVFGILLLAGHFFSIRALKHEQQMYETLTGQKFGPGGKKPWKKCKKWQKKQAAAAVVAPEEEQKPIVVAEPEIDYSTVYDPEIQEENDKVEEPTFAPSSTITNNNQMI